MVPLSIPPARNPILLLLLVVSDDADANDADASPGVHPMLRNRLVVSRLAIFWGALVVIPVPLFELELEFDEMFKLYSSNVPPYVSKLFPPDPESYE